MKKLLIGFIIIFSYFPVNIQAKIHHAVTYELSPGRFGDNLLSYIHAKWISYRYNIPLLYKPFIYSDQLILHEKEAWYSDSLRKQFDKVVGLGKHVAVNLDVPASTLYVAPYFPSSKWELQNCVSFSGGRWDHFEVDWQDKGFVEELRKVIAPQNPISPMQLPTDRITVAVHVRRGGNHDTPDVPAVFPLKFLPDSFYITQIKELYDRLDGKPLYVYLFTDDNNPEKIVKTFKRSLEGLNIQFSYRMQGNCDTANVVEDFFALQQLDCLIHSESNFSFIMSKLGDYMVSIYSDSFHRENGKVVYDHINISVKK